MKPMAKMVSGIKQRWLIQDLIGKGDAGEVVSVQSEGDGLNAVMKRPVQNATGGTIMRQAVQIENESRILARLDGLQLKQGDLTIATPRLLDTSIKGTSNTTAFFMVSQQMVGKALSVIIKEAHKEGSTIPHLLILSILSALFTMLKEVHRRGVLWNDVKTEHIYWNEAGKTISCIDWGNGLLMDEANALNGIRPSYMEDYRQLVAEMTSFLSAFAPDLLDDLNWPLNKVNEVDEREVDLLGIRLKYSREYLAARIVEKKGLINHYLQGLNDLDSLHELLTLVTSLEKSSETVQYSAIDHAAKDLLFHFAKTGDYASCQEVVQLLIEYKTAASDFSWALLREILEVLPLEDNALVEICELIFQEKWDDTLWQIYQYSGKSSKKIRLDELTLMIRQKALPGAINGALPIKLLRELVDELHVRLIQLRLSENKAQEGGELADLSARLDQVIRTWHYSDGKEQFGDDLWVLREILPALDARGFKIPPALGTLISGMLSISRTLYQTWHAGALSESRQAIRTLFLWDPEFDDLRSLDQSLEKTEKWINQLLEGPSMGQPVSEFLSSLVESKPDISERLGLPIWLKELTEALAEVIEKGNLSSLKAMAVSEALPMSWLVDQEDLFTTSNKVEQSNLTQEQVEMLAAFHQRLKSGESLAEPLSRIKVDLPLFYPYYGSLVHSTERILAPLERNVGLPDPSLAPQEDQAAVKQLVSMLQAVTGWRSLIESRNWVAAEVKLRDWQEWQIPADCYKAMGRWRRQILPVIADLRQKSRKASARISPELEQELGTLQIASKQMLDAANLWAKVEETSINLVMAEGLSACLTAAEEAFFKFWQGLSNDTSAGMRLIVQYNQAELSGTYHLLQQLARQARKVIQALEVLSRPEMALTRLALNSAGDLMYALLKLEDGLNSFNPQSLVRTWHQQYIEFLKIPSKSVMQVQLAGITDRHPLYAWFHELARDETGPAMI
jgi:serine/threonine protein kinase